MRTKKLLFLVVLSVLSMMTTQAQTKLVEEEISSSEWEAELLRLNPGADAFSVPINPNATNPSPYTTPTTLGGEVEHTTI